MSSKVLPFFRPPCLKGRFPFRLGTSSYIIEADLLPNITWLAPWIDDVELVLFETPGQHNIPSPADIKLMRSLASDQALTYTVHLLCDIDLGSADRSGQLQARDQHKKIMDICRELDPFAYILHLHGPKGGPPPLDDLRGWQERTKDSLLAILGRDYAPSELCVENLGYDFALLKPIIDDLGLSVCLDVGHLLLNNLDVVAFCGQWLARSRVIHLHGLTQGVDHISLKHLPPDLLASLLRQLTAFGERQRVLTMEIFNKEDFSSSLCALEQAWRQKE